MPYGAMDLTPLLCVVRAIERPLLLLVYGLLLMIPAIPTIPAITVVPMISSVGLPIVLSFLCGPLATSFMEPGSSLRGLNAYFNDYKQIGHHLWLLHGNLLNCLKIADPVTEGIDDLIVLDVRDSVPGIAEIFHVLPDAFIMLLLNGLQGLSCRWMLIRTLKVSDEHGT
jgi:hypothetical protein